jgi:hypothetical protein
MCKNLDSPHPLTPSPIFGRRGTRILCLPSPKDGRGAGGEGEEEHPKCAKTLIALIP